MTANSLAPFEASWSTNTVTLFQDDTGVPYRFFEKKPEWHGTFFGEYVAPVEDFSRGLYQPELDSAFKEERNPCLSL